jgi:FkbM family methyltransferase
MLFPNALRRLVLNAALLEARTLRLRGTHRLVTALYHPNDRAADYVSLVAPYYDGLIQIDTRSFIEWWIHVYGGFESGAIDLLRRLAHPGSVVLDVGANVGVFTLPLARSVGPVGQVHSFEPHPVIRRRLIENIALNNLSNVRVLDFALGGEDGQVTLFGATHSNQGQASLTHRPGLEDQIVVAMHTLDDYVQSARLPRVDLLKIDTEGAEFKVLSGATRTLASCRPCVYVEVSPAYLAQAGDNAGQIADLLYGLGYEIWVNHTVEQSPRSRGLRLSRLRDLGPYPTEGLDFYWLAVHPEIRLSEAGN